MTWMPGAIRKEVRRHRTRLSARGVCLHVAVSEAASLFGYFNQSGNATSHFYVRKDGTIEQYVSLDYRAPANLEGNSSLVSVETQGGVSNADSEPWTSAQREALAQICAFVHKKKSVPLQAMPNSRSSSKGIGYHRLGVDPWRVSGGEKWSSAYGKICPGQGKINQIPGIISRAKNIAGGNSTKDWFDLATKKDLEEVIDSRIDNIARAVWYEENPHTGSTYGYLLRRIWQVGGQFIQGHDSKISPHRAQELLYHWLSGNDQVGRPTDKEDTKSSIRYALQNMWHHLFNGVRPDASQTVRLLKAYQPLLEAAAEGRSLTKEEVALVASEVSQAVKDAVPGELAEDVADELGARLVPSEEEGTAA